MLRILFTLTLGLLLAGVARAQQLDNPVQVPVTYNGTATFYASGSFSFGSELGAVTSKSGPAGPQQVSPQVTAWVVAGKEYTITPSRVNVSLLLVHFQTSPLYDVYINDIRATTMGNFSTGNFRLRVQRVAPAELKQSEIVALSSTNAEPAYSGPNFGYELANERAGECSSFPEDKLIWYIGLGRLPDGRFAGALGFRADTISAALFTTASLIHGVVDPAQVVVTRTGGYITRIDAPQATILVDAYNASSTSYQIKVCPPASTTPFLTYTIRQHPSWGGTAVVINKEEDGKAYCTALKNVGSTWTLYGWRKSSGAPSWTFNETDFVDTVVSGSTRTIKYGEVSTANTALRLTTTKTFTTVNSRTELASVKQGTGGNDPITSYTYYATSTGSGWANAIETINDARDGWTKYEYYNGATTKAGQIYRIFRPWKDAPATAAAATSTNSLVETYDYVASYDENSLTAPSIKTVTLDGTTIGKTTWSYNWDNGSANTYKLTQTTESNYSSSSNWQTTVTVAYHPGTNTTVPVWLRGKPHSVTYPDGTKRAYAYFSGTWNASTSTFTAGAGSDRLTYVFFGQASSGSGTTAVSSWSKDSLSWTMGTIHLVGNLSTVNERVTNAAGREVFSADNIYAGGSTIERLSGLAISYNGQGLRTETKDIMRSVPGVVVAATYGYTGGLPSSTVAIDGTKTEIPWTDRDEWLRPTKVKKSVGGTAPYPEVEQAISYYSSGLKKTSQDCSCSPNAKSYTYDEAGRVDTEIEPKPGGGDLLTDYLYTNARQTEVKKPDGGTLKIDLYLDGRVKREHGTGRIETNYDYTCDSGTGYLKTKMIVGASDATGWKEDARDWLGRVRAERTPQFGWDSSGNSSKVLRRESSYDNTTGQLRGISVYDETTGNRALSDYRYDYGTLGRLVAEGTDFGNNQSLDVASVDRIKYYHSFYFKDTSGYNGWVRTDQVKVLREFNTAAEVVVSHTNTRLTRFNNGVALNGAAVLSDVVWLGPGGESSVDWTWVVPSTRSKTRYFSSSSAGNAALTYWQDGYLKSEQSPSGVTVTHSYYGTGLLEKSTQATTNAVTSLEYHPGTRFLQKHTQTTGTSTTTTQTYAYAWDDAAGLTKVTVTDQAGHAAYTEYDQMGRVKRTWGAAASPAEYTYYLDDPSGRRTELRTWRSGDFTAATWPTLSGASVTKWMLDRATGLTKEKWYDGAQPVTYTYTNTGQPYVTTWARGTTVTRAYHPNGQLNTVSYSDGTPGLAFGYGRVGEIDWLVDQTGFRDFVYRSSDLKLDYEQLPSYYDSKRLTMAYDTAGRLTGYNYSGGVTAGVGFDGPTGRVSSITGTNGAGTATFALTYEAGTDLVANASSGNFLRQMSYVPETNIRERVTTSWTTGATSMELGKFKASYTDVRGWMNSHQGGDLTAPAGSWSQVLGLNNGIKSTLGYNDRGELTSSTPSWTGGSGTQLLGGRTFGWSYDLAGNRETETGTTPTTYSTADTNSNARGSLNQYEAITGVLAESTLIYDADGNLTQAGTWTYAYDGENRIKSITGAGMTLVFEYDYLGRRVRKTVSGTATADLKFIWSGWKLVAELNGGTAAVQRSFVWGPDFSDGRGAAGGAGSLLAEISGGATTYAMADALGNIVGYINASGSLTLAREYSPYRLVRAAGSTANGNHPIGYSGQYTDWETGLVYYGLRYYNPKHGRFINRDPIAEQGGLNLYGFVGNAPSRGWDVLGMGTEAVSLPEGGYLPNFLYLSHAVTMAPFVATATRDRFGEYLDREAIERTVYQFTVSLVNRVEDRVESIRNLINGASGGSSPGGAASNAPSKAPDCAALKAKYAKYLTSNNQFQSADEAAIGAAIYIAVIGGADRLDGKTEFGAGVIQIVGQDGQTRYGFTAITRGFTDGKWFSPHSPIALERNELYWNVTQGQFPGVSAVAYIHSHPTDYGLPEADWRSGSNFSVWDLDFSKLYRQNAYLLAPNGALKRSSYDSYDWPPTTTDLKGVKINDTPNAKDLADLAKCKF